MELKRGFYKIAKNYITCDMLKRGGLISNVVFEPIEKKTIIAGETDITEAVYVTGSGEFIMIYPSKKSIKAKWYAFEVIADVQVTYDDKGLTFSGIKTEIFFSHRFIDHTLDEMDVKQMFTFAVLENYLHLTNVVPQYDIILHPEDTEYPKVEILVLLNGNLYPVGRINKTENGINIKKDILIITDDINEFIFEETDTNMSFIGTDVSIKIDNSFLRSYLAANIIHSPEVKDE